MGTVAFANIADMKKQPTSKKIGGLGGFPQPMKAQMEQKPLRRRVKFPRPDKPKGK